MEYKIKAGYIFNFIKLIGWPTNAFTQPDSPWRIGLVGDKLFVDTIAKQLDGKVLVGRPIEVIQMRADSALDTCHVLVLGVSERYEARRIVDRVDGLKKLPVLTITEITPVDLPGMILYLYRDRDRFRFAIDLDGAKEASLKVSANLASLATIIKSKAVIPQTP